MSSTGTITKGSLPISKEGENKRKTQQEMGALPNLDNATRMAYGKITQIDPDKALIKAIDITNGIPIANGRWIVLSHSVREITERWGKIQRGQLVLIQYQGPAGDNAIASIIKETGEDIADTQLLENNISQGVYKIFAPGSLGF